jgi:UDP-glucuronate 4-epimerase
LDKFITILEEKLGKKAKRILLPMQPGDVPATYAEIADLERDIGFKPKTPLREGIGRFVDWYLDYYCSDGMGEGQTICGSRSEGGLGHAAIEA